MPSVQTFLYIFANKRSSLHNCLFLILNWFLVLYIYLYLQFFLESLYLNFVYVICNLILSI